MDELRAVTASVSGRGAELLRAKAVNKRVAELAQSLCSPGASLPALLTASELFTPAHLADVVEERSIAGICGWPPCAAAPSKHGTIPTRELVEDAKAGIRTPAEDRRHYCSASCHKAGRYVSMQLSLTLPVARLRTQTAYGVRVPKLIAALRAAAVPLAPGVIDSGSELAFSAGFIPAAAGRDKFSPGAVSAAEGAAGHSTRVPASIEASLRIVERTGAPSAADASLPPLAPTSVAEGAPLLSMAVDGFVPAGATAVSATASFSASPDGRTTGGKVRSHGRISGDIALDSTSASLTVDPAQRDAPSVLLNTGSAAAIVAAAATIGLTSLRRAAPPPAPALSKRAVSAHMSPKAASAGGAPVADAAGRTSAAGAAGAGSSPVRTIPKTGSLVSRAKGGRIIVPVSEARSNPGPFDHKRMRADTSNAAVGAGAGAGAGAGGIPGADASHRHHDGCCADDSAAASSDKASKVQPAVDRVRVKDDAHDGDGGDNDNGDASSSGSSDLDAELARLILPLSFETRGARGKTSTRALDSAAAIDLTPVVVETGAAAPSVSKSVGSAVAAAKPAVAATTATGARCGEAKAAAGAPRLADRAAFLSGTRPSLQQEAEMAARAAKAKSASRSKTTAAAADSASSGSGSAAAASHVSAADHGRSVEHHDDGDADDHDDDNDEADDGEDGHELDEDFWRAYSMVGDSESEGDDDDDDNDGGDGNGAGDAGDAGDDDDDDGGLVWFNEPVRARRRGGKGDKADASKPRKAAPAADASAELAHVSSKDVAAVAGARPVADAAAGVSREKAKHVSFGEIVSVAAGPTAVTPGPPLKDVGTAGVGADARGAAASGTAPPKAAAGIELAAPSDSSDRHDAGGGGAALLPITVSASAMRGMGLNGASLIAALLSGWRTIETEELLGVRPAGSSGSDGGNSDVTAGRVGSGSRGADSDASAGLQAQEASASLQAALVGRLSLLSGKLSAVADWIAACNPGTKASAAPSSAASAGGSAAGSAASSASSIPFDQFRAPGASAVVWRDQGSDTARGGVAERSVASSGSGSGSSSSSSGADAPAVSPGAADVAVESIISYAGTALARARLASLLASLDLRDPLPELEAHEWRLLGLVLLSALQDSEPLVDSGNGFLLGVPASLGAPAVAAILAARAEAGWSRSRNGGRRLVASAITADWRAEAARRGAAADAASAGTGSGTPGAATRAARHARDNAAYTVPPPEPRALAMLETLLLQPSEHLGLEPGAAAAARVRRSGFEPAAAEAAAETAAGAGAGAGAGSSAAPAAACAPAQPVAWLDLTAGWSSDEDESKSAQTGKAARGRQAASAAGAGRVAAAASTGTAGGSTAAAATAGPGALELKRGFGFEPVPSAAAVGTAASERAARELAALEQAELLLVRHAAKMMGAGAGAGQPSVVMPTRAGAGAGAGAGAVSRSGAGAAGPAAAAAAASEGSVFRRRQAAKRAADAGK